MSTEIALRPVNGNSLHEVMQLGQVFKASGYFRDIRDEAQAVTKILYGRELGFTPIVSIMGIHIIEGKPALSSNLLATLIKRSGKYDYRVKENTAQRCVIEFRQGAEILGDAEFTIEEANKAGVVRQGSGWTKYPKAMLFARALSAGVRAHCPDVTACPMYVPEELGATVTEEGEVTELPKTRAVEVERTTEDIPIAPVVSTPTNAPVLGKPADGGNTPEVEYINLNQQRHFHRSFREALHENLKPHAEKLAADWLKSKGYVRDGKPSTKGIEAALYPEVHNEAIAWAKALS